MHNLTTGAIVSCASYLGSPCSSVKAFPSCSISPKPKPCMTVGKSAEFIIENGTSGALTDFVVPFGAIEQSAGVQMEGWATNTSGVSYGSGDDPAVTLLTDTSAGAHGSPFMAIGIDEQISGTCFTVSASFSGPLTSCGGVPVPPPPPGGGGGGVGGGGGGVGCYENGIPVHCPGCNPSGPQGGGCRLQ